MFQNGGVTLQHPIHIILETFKKSRGWRSTVNSAFTHFNKKVPSLSSSITVQTLTFDLSSTLPGLNTVCLLNMTALSLCVFLSIWFSWIFPPPPARVLFLLSHDPQFVSETFLISPDFPPEKTGVTVISECSPPYFTDWWSYVFLFFFGFCNSAFSCTVCHMGAAEGYAWSMCLY